MTTKVSNTFSVTVSATGNLTWTKPTTLANGDAIPVSTITGYKVYKDTGSGFSLVETITDENTLSANVTGNTGDRFAVATTYANGQSPLSWPVRDEGHASVASATIVGPGEDYEYSALQTALDNASPGDTIYIRGGTVQHAISGSDTFLTASVSGTSGNPITLASYPGEWAILSGRGAINAHPNTIGQPSTTVPTPNANERVLVVSGDYWTIRDLEIKDSQNTNLWVYGNYVDVEYCYVHNSWSDNILLGTASTTLTDVSVSFCETAYGLHGAGISFRPSNNPHSNFTCDHILAHHNGYLEATDLIAQPAQGDASGGGNSDGLVVFKDAETNGSPVNLLDGCEWKNVMAWNNADDNYDFNAAGNAWMLNCWGWDAGPQGQKFLKHFLASQESRVVAGCWAGKSTIGGTNTYELRQDGDYDFYNNQVMNTSTYGMRSDAVGSTTATIRNYLSHGNGNIDVTSGFDTLSNNHFNTDPTPDIETPTFSKPTISFPVTAQNLRTNFWDRWNHLYRQIQQAMLPIAAGSIVDGGYLQSGVHSATAADDATTPADPELTLMRWTKAVSPTASTGTAPDIGAVQYTYINPPDDVSLT